MVLADAIFFIFKKKSKTFHNSLETGQAQILSAIHSTPSLLGFLYRGLTAVLSSICRWWIIVIGGVQTESEFDCEMRHILFISYRINDCWKSITGTEGEPPRFNQKLAKLSSVWMVCPMKSMCIYMYDTSTQRKT